MTTDAQPAAGLSGRAQSGGHTLTGVRAFAADIKLSHSVFALPFAASALLLSPVGLPSMRQILLLLICMVTARSCAMGMNRYLDRHIDGANPRTIGRMIPAGRISSRQTLAWSVGAGAAFAAAAAALSDLAGYLALPLLAILVFYSAMKRVSWLTHWYLGICLGLAPLAVEVALTGSASPATVVLGLAVSFWTGGFDILYSLQDMAFDRQHRLHSVPGRFGPHVSLWLSRFSFASMVLCLAWAGYLGGCGAVYFSGVAVIGTILIVEHVLVRDARLDGRSRHINQAFFSANAWVSTLYLVFLAADRAAAGWIQI